MGRSPMLEVQVGRRGRLDRLRRARRRRCAADGIAVDRRAGRVGGRPPLAGPDARQSTGSLPTQQLRQSLVHELIDLQVSDLLQVAVEQLRSVEGHSTDEVSDAGLRLRHSDSLAEERSELEAFLFDAVYRHERLIPVRAAAALRLRTLFEKLTEHPERLPLRFRQRAKELPIQKAVGEYLAGMTDAFCDTPVSSNHRNFGWPAGRLVTVPDRLVDLVEIVEFMVS